MVSATGDWGTALLGMAVALLPWAVLILVMFFFERTDR
jgi:hypothetical protein